MNIYQAYITTLLIIFIVTGCEFHLNTGERSGTIENDYIEEPISKSSRKYENALVASNAVIDKLIEGNYSYIQDNLIQNDMKSVLTKEAIKSLITQASNALGPITNYKKMQWGFVPAEENGNKILLSFKIVEHRKGEINYKFVFEDNGRYEKLIGLHMKSHTGARPPNEI